MSLTALLIIVMSLIMNGYTAKKESHIPKDEGLSIVIRDLQEAIALAGINIFNFDIAAPQGASYKLHLFLDEFENSKLIKEKEIIRFNAAYAIFDGNKKLEKVIDQLRIINHKFDHEGLYGGKQNKTQVKTAAGANTFLFTIDEKYPYPHEFRKFKKSPLITGKKVPLLLYGSYWHDGNFVRFCTQREMDPDFGNDAFNLMPHYYVFSYQWVRQ